MEYVITTGQPFDEIEAQTIVMLQKQGLVVQRTFSLRSAVGADRRDLAGPHQQRAAPSGEPGYSVLMLYAPGVQVRPLGLLTLYERGGWTVIKPIRTLTKNGQNMRSGDPDEVETVDSNADLFAALMQSGLDFCVEIASSEGCVDLRREPEGAGASSGRLVQDPVCGKWLDLGEAEAVIEREDVIYHVCSPVCRRAFEREPVRYAQPRERTDSKGWGDKCSVS